VTVAVRMLVKGLEVGFDYHLADVGEGGRNRQKMTLCETATWTHRSPVRT
jgi:hypothetical protein